jgi:hypothetical protein
MSPKQKHYKVKLTISRLLNDKRFQKIQKYKTYKIPNINFLLRTRNSYIVEKTVVDKRKFMQIELQAEQICVLVVEVALYRACII